MLGRYDSVKKCIPPKPWYDYNHSNIADSVKSYWQQLVHVTYHLISLSQFI